jgi:transcription elongation factor GreA
MARDQIAMPPLPTSARASAAPAGAAMSSDEYALLVRELEVLRAAHRSDLAQRLHDVRAHGSTGDDDDLLAVLDEAAIDWARIAQLEHLVRRAAVVDEAQTEFDGAAGLGSTIRVADDAGRIIEYRLIGRRTSGSPPGDVSLGSPVGNALIGARTGDVVQVALPSGRDRTLTVLAVSGGIAERRAAAA